MSVEQDAESGRQIPQELKHRRKCKPRILGPTNSKWCDNYDADDDDDDDVDGVVGRVVLGSFMFSRGKELEHWNRMMNNVDEQVVQWHSLM